MKAALALALAGLLWADGAEASDFEWDVPGVLASSEVGNGGAEAFGIPLRMWAVRSSWKLEPLFREYERRFAKAGFWVEPNQKPLPGLSLTRLTALDTDSLWAYTIIFYTERDGTTTVLLGGADLKHRRPPPSEGIAPVFPGATQVVHSSVEAARAVSFLVSASRREVTGFYQEVLTGSGYRQKDETTYVRGDVQLKLVIGTNESTPLAVVVIAQQAPHDEPAPAPFKP